MHYGPLIALCSAILGGCVTGQDVIDSDGAAGMMRITEYGAQTTGGIPFVAGDGAIGGCKVTEIGEIRSQVQYRGQRCSVTHTPHDESDGWSE